MQQIATKGIPLNLVYGQNATKTQGKYKIGWLLIYASNIILKFLTELKTASKRV